MSDSNHDGTKDYRFMAMVYDPAFERFMRPIREKALQISDVRQGDRVLDLCCGTGRQAKLFAEAGADVCGVGLSDFMIAKAKKKAKRFPQRDGQKSGAHNRMARRGRPLQQLPEVDERGRTCGIRFQGRAPSRKNNRN